MARGRADRAGAGRRGQRRPARTGQRPARGGIPTSPAWRCRCFPRRAAGESPRERFGWPRSGRSASSDCNGCSPSPRSATRHRSGRSRRPASTARASSAPTAGRTANATTASCSRSSRRICQAPPNGEKCGEVGKIGSTAAAEAGTFEAPGLLQRSTYQARHAVSAHAGASRQPPTVSPRPRALKRAALTTRSQLEQQRGAATVVVV
jgi:hypothetical protein